MTQIAALFHFLKAFPEANLTGSHAFGNATSSSDIDVYMKDSPEMRQALVDYGAVQITAYEYKDSLTAVVYVWQRIHIQLVACVALKNEAQKFLMSLPRPLAIYYLGMLKADKKLVWDWAVKMVSSIQEAPSK